MTAEHPLSLWESTSEEPDSTAPFAPGEACDVAIVGAGYTGLSTALHCAERGLSAHVIEAEKVGFGGSGRNVGLVNAGVWLPPEEVPRALGEGYGPRFLKAFGEGPTRVFELIERHQMRCEVTRTGTIHAAHAPSGMKNLRMRHTQWQKLGAPVDLLSREEMVEATGSRAFHGGLLDHRAGTINPMGYARGLARAARGAGARISTGARVTQLLPEPRGWRVITSRGELTAKAVVLGTNAYSDALWPGLAKSYTLIHFVQIATAPLGEAGAHILPGKQGLWTTAPVMLSARRDAAGRLIMGSMGRLIGGAEAGLTARWARRQIAKHFPGLGKVAFEEAWHGQIAMTPDHMPRIHQLAPGLWTPIGYNGRGITTGTLFGQAMAGLLTGMDPAGLVLPLSDPQSVASAPLMRRLYDVAFTANQLWKGL